MEATCFWVECVCPERLAWVMSWIPWWTTVKQKWTDTRKIIPQAKILSSGVMIPLSFFENHNYDRSGLKISLKYWCLNGSVWDKLRWPCVLTVKRKDQSRLTVPSFFRGLVHDFPKSYLGIIYGGWPDTLPGMYTCSLKQAASLGQDQGRQDSTKIHNFHFFPSLLFSSWGKLVITGPHLYF